jgi:hypothetical protein
LFRFVSDPAEKAEIPSAPDPPIQSIVVEEQEELVEEVGEEGEEEGEGGEEEEEDEEDEDYLLIPKPTPSTTTTTPTPTTTPAGSRFISVQDVLSFVKQADETYGSDDQMVDKIIQAKTLIERLPEVSFDVQKVLRKRVLGVTRAKRRVIRIRGGDIFHVKVDGKGREEVTKKHSLMDVAGVELLDTERFRLSFRSGAARDYEFKSPVSQHIVQELQGRLAIVQTTVKKLQALSNRDVGMKIQQELKRDLYNNPAAPSSSSSSSFSPGGGGGGRPAAMSSAVDSSSAISSVMFMSSRGAAGDASARSRAVSVSPAAAASPRERAATLAASSPLRAGMAGGGAASASTMSDSDRRAYSKMKLTQMFGDTEAQRMDVAINSICLGKDTEVKRTIEKFRSDFGKLEKASPAKAAQEVRGFVDNLKAYIIEHHSADIAKTLVHAGAPREYEESAEETVAGAVERALERAIIAPLAPRIKSCIYSGMKEQTRELEAKIRSILGKPQSFFGIPNKHASKSRWGAAVSELGRLDCVDAPYQKVEVLLATAKAIYKTYIAEHTGAAESFLAADDFLPIFIYVIVNSEIDCPEATCELLWVCSDQSELRGEGGYYLTSFSSALHHIKHHDFFDHADQLMQAKLADKQRERGESVAKDG